MTIWFGNYIYLCTKVSQSIEKYREYQLDNFLFFTLCQTSAECFLVSFPFFMDFCSLTSLIQSIIFQLNIHSFLFIRTISICFHFISVSLQDQVLLLMSNDTNSLSRPRRWNKQPYPLGDATPKKLSSSCNSPSLLCTDRKQTPDITKRNSQNTHYSEGRKNDEESQTSFLHLKSGTNNFKEVLRQRFNSNQKYMTKKDYELNINFRGPLEVRSSQKQSLQDIVRKFRVKRLIESFVRKMKKNLTPGIPSFETEEQSLSMSLGLRRKEKEGYGLQCKAGALINFIGIILIIAVNLKYQLAAVFPESEEFSNSLDQKIFKVCEWASLVWFLLYMVVKFTCKSYENGKALLFLKQIAKNYLITDFWTDVLTIIIIFYSLVLSTPSSYFTYFRLLVGFQCITIPKKMTLVDKLIGNNFQRQQYIGILSVFLLNLFSAHVLSIILNCLPCLDPDYNWITVKGLQDSPWFQRYIWGTYWASTIMLTVGFGDIAASNYKEAFCLMIVEMVSCMLLSYNINYVGNLISNIRLRSIQKDRAVKLFTSMASSSIINQDLENRILNSIQGSFLINKDFNIDEQNKLLEKLPLNLKKEYLKKMSLLRNLTLQIRTILSENINKIITHPEQIVQKNGQFSRLLILSQGTLALCTKPVSKFHINTSIQTITCSPNNKQQNRHKLLSLGFIRQYHIGYDIKSVGYSIIYCIEREELIKILKHSHIDYEYFCQLRDEYSTDQVVELLECQHCPGELHSKFNCPKYHYIPLRDHKGWRNYTISNRKKQQRELDFKRSKQLWSLKKSNDCLVACFQFLRDLRQKEVSVASISSSSSISQSTFNEFERYQTSQLKNIIQSNHKKQGSSSSGLPGRTTRRKENPGSSRISSQLGKMNENLQNSFRYAKMNSFKRSLPNDPNINGRVSVNSYGRIGMPRNSIYNAILERLDRMTVMKEAEEEILQIDGMYNWRHYFPQSNPKNLATRIVPKKPGLLSSQP